jgi:DNA ligase-1
MKPLLAEKTRIEDVRFPVYASAKLDGIRCLIRDGRPVSRMFLPIPNDDIVEKLSFPELSGFDGELIVGSPTDEKCFNNTTRIVGKKSAVTTDWRYYVFDDFGNPNCPYHQRLESLQARTRELQHPNIVLLDQKLLCGGEALIDFEEFVVNAGYEGAMIRSPDGKYKFGRSTVNEGILLKLKRFVDTEVEILDVFEGQTNHNVATKDALGHTKRSTAKAGKVGNGTLGAFLVREIDGQYAGRTFRVGGGWDAAEGARLWAVRESLSGRVFTCRYQAVGALNKPRFPQYKGLREAFDMGEPE